MDSHNQDQSALHHLSRTVQNRANEDTSEGNERMVYANDEINKRDVMVVDDCALHMSQLQKAREQSVREQQERLALVEMQQDEQLKELGLFEEGMTRDQKRELLEVVATSRETAREEENRRQRTRDWENKILYVDEVNRENCNQHLKHSDGSTDHLYNPPVTYRQERNNNHEKQRDESPLLKSQGTSSPSDLDEDTQPLCSQELFRTPTSGDEMDPAYSQEENLTQKTISETPVSDQRNYLRSLTIHRSNSNPSAGDKMMDEVQYSNCQAASEEADSQEHLSVWPSPDSPLSVSLCQRFLPNMSEKVPFFCPYGMQPREYTCKILESISEYHKELYKSQRNSVRLCHWGEPISIGRHHPNSIDVIRRGVRNKQMTENDDALMLRKMVAEQCIETTIDDDSYSLPDLEEWTSDRGPLYQSNSKDKTPRKYRAISSSDDCDQQESESDSVKQTLNVQETDNKDYSFSVNKQDFVMECENSDISSINVELCEKPSLQDVHQSQSSAVESDCLLNYNNNNDNFNVDSIERTNETSQTLDASNNVSSQTDKVQLHSASSYHQGNECRHQFNDGELSKQVNHVLSSANFQNHKNEGMHTIIHEDAEITVAEIQIECLPSKRDKRNYARGPKQMLKPRKIIEEDKQRKRKFDEEFNRQDNMKSSGKDILPPIKRKV